jgi:hypothetical protein
MEENQSVKKRLRRDANAETEQTVATGLGSGSAGQSGDLQGLSDAEDTDSESVTELLEEGQYFEASVISGIENAPPADIAEVKTREVPADDVPAEYLQEDEPPV